MKKFKFLPIFFIFSIVLSAVLAPTALALQEPEVAVGAAVLFERNTREVLFSRNADTRMYPASTTKIMTALLAVEAVEDGSVSMEDEVTASDNYHQGYEDDGSTCNIVAGETMTLRDLLYCALLGSANEACNIIAEYIGGSIENFVAMMNQRAAELGCTGTHFANPHGYQDPNHYTTAYDMCLIADECADRASFMEICGSAAHTVPATDMAGERKLTNSNALLSDESLYGDAYLYEPATGMKTGYTSDAGYCLVSTATKSGIDLVCVVMGCAATDNGDGTMTVGSFTNTATLFDWAFDNYSYQNILSSSTIVARTSVDMGKDTDYVSLHPQTSIRLFLPNDYDMSRFEQRVVVYSERDGEKLTAPISAGEVLGEITLVRGEEIVDTVPLVATSSVALSKVSYMKQQLAELLQNKSLRKIVRILVILFVLYVVWVIIYRVRRIVHLASVRRAKRDRARAIAQREAQYNARRQDPYAQRGGRQPDIGFFSEDGEEGEGDIEAKPYTAPPPAPNPAPAPAVEAEPLWQEDGGAPEAGAGEEPEQPQRRQDDLDFFEQLFRK